MEDPKTCISSYFYALRRQKTRQVQTLILSSILCRILSQASFQTSNNNFPATPLASRLSELPCSHPHKVGEHYCDHHHVAHTHTHTPNSSGGVFTLPSFLPYLYSPGYTLFDRISTPQDQGNPLRSPSRSRRRLRLHTFRNVCSTARSGQRNS